MHDARDDIEAIKQLKARYFRLMDCKQWDELAACFCRDIRADYGEYGGVVEGREALAASMRHELAEAVTVHHGHMPEITLIDADTATGIWAMEDRVQRPDLTLHGFGHYHERYRREDGAWRIADLRLTRLRLDVQHH